MSYLHSFKFKTELSGKPTYISIDGKELHGVTEADIHYSVNELPYVRLTITANKIEVNAEDVYVNSEVKNEMPIQDQTNSYEEV